MLQVEWQEGCSLQHPGVGARRLAAGAVHGGDAGGGDLGLRQREQGQEEETQRGPGSRGRGRQEGEEGAKYIVTTG